MKKDSIDNLFKNLEGQFNTSKAPEEHKNRFLDKLNTQNRTKTKKIKSNFRFKKMLAVAAVLAIIVTISSLYINTETSSADLASISPEMEQTQSFFTSSINKELQTLKKFTSPETKTLVQDALKQITILENKYELLKKDLVKSGNDKRVVYAMIQNFQNRIELLTHVINKIEEVKNLKVQKNENTI